MVEQLQALLMGSEVPVAAMKLAVQKCKLELEDAFLMLTSEE